MGEFYSPFRVFCGEERGLRERTGQVPDHLAGLRKILNTMASHGGILLTAFEPSGDVLAAPVIEALRATRPDLPLWALGGPLMRKHGAELIDLTTREAVMLMGTVGQVGTHCRRLRHLRQWLRDRNIAVHVPVDSPAANWSICRTIRRVQPATRTLHLVAPQLWAWGSWRLAKLRRLTDHVLCLLPFEPQWFEARGIKASFVGHPIFDRDPPIATNPPGSTPKLVPAEVADSDAKFTLAILPGSRPAEIRNNFPTMFGAFNQLRVSHPNLRAVVAAVDSEAADLIRQISSPKGLPEGMCMEIDRTDSVIAGADLALVTSGTATLQVAAHSIPMAAIYNINKWLWYFAGQWLIHTRTFALPNVIAERRGLGHIIPEFVPHFGRVEPVARALTELVQNPTVRSAQHSALKRVCEPFAGCRFAANVAGHILHAMDEKK